MKQILELLRQRGYAPADARFATGPRNRTGLALMTPAGLLITAKAFPDADGERMFSNMQKLWQSSFGGRRQPPGLLQPVEYLADDHVLILQHLPGKRLVDLGRWGDKSFDDALRLLAALHDSDAVPEMRRSSRGILRALGRKMESLAARTPELAEPFRQVTAALETARRRDAELVPCHGSFSPRQIWVAPAGVLLTGWDRFQLAAPARDLAHLGAWAWVGALRENKTPDWSLLERAVEIYHSARPAAGIEGQMPFHVAAALMHLACRLADARDDQVQLVPRVIAEALRQLH